MENKKIVIHQPAKYGDFLIVIPIVYKLMENGYNVWFPHCIMTKELLQHFPDIKTFEVECYDSRISKEFAINNNAKFINCQSSEEYNSLCTIYGGNLFIEELKYYVVNQNVDININYKDKYNLSWKRNYNREKEIFKILNISENDEYIVTHTVGENGRIGFIPQNEKRKRIEISKINGFTLLDWFLVIKNSQAVYAIQSSTQAFVDGIKYHLNNKPLYLLNDTSNIDRLLVPAYDWDFTFFKKK